MFWSHHLGRGSRCLVGLGVAGLALLAAGCGGGSKPPSVANLGTTSTRTTGNNSPGSATATGNPSQLLTEWAACMRSHGDPNQADPTIDANKVIHITFPASWKGGARNACSAYMGAASKALMGGQRPQRPDPAKLMAFSACMRVNGVPDFPDPSGGGLSLNGNKPDLNPHSPTFQNAQKVCGKKTGITGPLAGGPPQPGMIMANG